MAAGPAGPAGGAYSTLIPPSWIWGIGGEREGNEGEGRREGREREKGEGREGERREIFWTP